MPWYSASNQEADGWQSSSGGILAMGVAREDDAVPTHSVLFSTLVASESSILLAGLSVLIAQADEFDSAPGSGLGFPVEPAIEINIAWLPLSVSIPSGVAVETGSGMPITVFRQDRVYAGRAYEIDSARPVSGLMGFTINAPTLIETDKAPASLLDFSYTDTGLEVGVRRWRFRDMTTLQQVILPLNPNEMDAPATSRGMQWAWSNRDVVERDSGQGVLGGSGRARGFDNGQQNPTQWSFSGVILAKNHYDLLLEWSERLRVIRVTDHLGQQFDVIFQKFEPTEGRSVRNRPWKMTYTMTCLLLKKVA